jgi:hypothetical protein
MRKELGKYFIDISKLTFGGVVLSVILEISANKLIVLIAGSLATILLALWGFLLLKIKYKRRK